MGGACLGTFCQSVSTGTSTTPRIGLRASQALAAGSTEAARLLPASANTSRPAFPLTESKACCCCHTAAHHTQLDVKQQGQLRHYCLARNRTKQL